MNIKLGVIVKDMVTGLVGVAENRATFLYGCDRYYVQPRVREDGSVPSGMMIDAPQLRVAELEAPVMEPAPEPEQLVQLGQLVFDPVCGREGTATGRSVYLNGCSRIFVEPKQVSDREIPGWWVDEQQLELRDESVLKTDHTQKQRSVGGPARSCSKY